MNNRYHIIGIDKKCLFSLWIKLEFSSFNDIDHSLGKAVREYNSNLELETRGSHLRR